MNKRRKSRDSVKKKDEPSQTTKDKLIKFNFSYDNLKCFIDQRYPKTDRKRVSNRYGSNLTDEKKYKQDSESNSGVEIHHTFKRDSSPDPSLQASNLIIEQIEKKGMKCTWNEIEQARTQLIEEAEWQATERIHQAFSQGSSSYGENSHASTIDRFPKGYYPMNDLRSIIDECARQQQQMVLNGSGDYLAQTVLANSEYILIDKMKYYDCNVFEINPLTIGHDPRTTLMIRNIPNKYTIHDLSHEIDLHFANTYDFLYLPCDIKNSCNVGYGFINFLNTEILFDFYKTFHNKRWVKFRSDKICVLTYARLQGLSSLIDHFQNSKVLNHKDKRYQPIIKDITDCKKIETLIQQQKSQHSSINNQ